MADEAWVAVLMLGVTSIAILGGLELPQESPDRVGVHVEEPSIEPREDGRGGEDDGPGQVDAPTFGCGEEGPDVLQRGERAGEEHEQDDGEVDDAEGHAGEVSPG